MLRALLIFCIYLTCLPVNGQTTEPVSTILCRQAFKNDKTLPAPKRPFLNIKKKSSLYNPLTYIGGGLLFFYQNVISEQFQVSCNYKISCSEYTKLCIQKYGLPGVFMGLNQISDCFPGAMYEHSWHFVDHNFKIINQIEYQ